MVPSLRTIFVIFFLILCVLFCVDIWSANAQQLYYSLTTLYASPGIATCDKATSFNDVLNGDTIFRTPNIISTSLSGGIGGFLEDDTSNENDNNLFNFDQYNDDYTDTSNDDADNIDFTTQSIEHQHDDVTLLNNNYNEENSNNNKNSNNISFKHQIGNNNNSNLINNLELTTCTHKELQDDTDVIPSLTPTPIINNNVIISGLDIDRELNTGIWMQLNTNREESSLQITHHNGRPILFDPFNSNNNNNGGELHGQTDPFRTLTSTVTFYLPDLTYSNVQDAMLYIRGWVSNELQEATANGPISPIIYYDLFSTQYLNVTNNLYTNEIRITRDPSTLNHTDNKYNNPSQQLVLRSVNIENFFADISLATISTNSTIDVNKRYFTVQLPALPKVPHNTYVLVLDAGYDVLTGDRLYYEINLNVVRYCYTFFTGTSATACNNRGRCLMGYDKCLCDEGYYGDLCQYESAQSCDTRYLKSRCNNHGYFDYGQHYNCTVCKCHGGWESPPQRDLTLTNQCSICPLTCPIGKIPNDDCTTCQCQFNIGVYGGEDCNIGLAYIFLDMQHMPEAQGLSPTQITEFPADTTISIGVASGVRRWLTAHVPLEFKSYVIASKRVDIRTIQLTILEYYNETTQQWDGGQWFEPIRQRLMLSLQESFEQYRESLEYSKALQNINSIPGVDEMPLPELFPQAQIQSTIGLYQFSNTPVVPGLFCNIGMGCLHKHGVGGLVKISPIFPQKRFVWKCKTLQQDGKTFTYEQCDQYNSGQWTGCSWEKNRGISRLYEVACVDLEDNNKRYSLDFTQRRRFINRPQQQQSQKMDDLLSKNYFAPDLSNLTNSKTYLILEELRKAIEIRKRNTTSSTSTNFNININNLSKQVKYDILNDAMKTVDSKLNNNQDNGNSNNQDNDEINILQASNHTLQPFNQSDLVDPILANISSHLTQYEFDYYYHLFQSTYFRFEEDVESYAQYLCPEPLNIDESQFTIAESMPYKWIKECTCEETFDRSYCEQHYSIDNNTLNPIFQLNHNDQQQDEQQQPGIDKLSEPLTIMQANNDNSDNIKKNWTLPIYYIHNLQILNSTDPTLTINSSSLWFEQDIEIQWTFNTQIMVDYPNFMITFSLVYYYNNTIPSYYNQSIHPDITQQFLSVQGDPDWLLNNEMSIPLVTAPAWQEKVKIRLPSQQMIETHKNNYLDYLRKLNLFEIPLLDHLNFKFRLRGQLSRGNVDSTAIKTINHAFHYFNAAPRFDPIILDRSIVGTNIGLVPALTSIISTDSLIITNKPQNVCKCGNNQICDFHSNTCQCEPGHGPGLIRSIPLIIGFDEPIIDNSNPQLSYQLIYNKSIVNINSLIDGQIISLNDNINYTFNPCVKGCDNVCFSANTGICIANHHTEGIRQCACKKIGFWGDKCHLYHTCGGPFLPPPSSSTNNPLNIQQSSYHQQQQQIVKTQQFNSLSTTNNTSITNYQCENGLPWDFNVINNNPDLSVSDVDSLIRSNNDFTLGGRCFDKCKCKALYKWDYMEGRCVCDFEQFCHSVGTDWETLDLIKNSQSFNESSSSSSQNNSTITSLLKCGICPCVDGYVGSRCDQREYMLSFEISPQKTIVVDPMFGQPLPSLPPTIDPDDCPYLIHPPNIAILDTTLLQRIQRFVELLNIAMPKHQLPFEITYSHAAFIHELPPAREKTVHNDENLEVLQYDNDNVNNLINHHEILDYRNDNNINNHTSNNNIDDSNNYEDLPSPQATSKGPTLVYHKVLEDFDITKAASYLQSCNYIYHPYSVSHIRFNIISNITLIDLWKNRYITYPPHDEAMAALLNKYDIHKIQLKETFTTSGTELAALDRILFTLFREVQHQMEIDEQIQQQQQQQQQQQKIENQIQIQNNNKQNIMSVQNVDEENMINGTDNNNTSTIHNNITNLLFSTLQRTNNYDPRAIEPPPFILPTPNLNKMDRIPKLRTWDDISTMQIPLHKDFYQFITTIPIIFNYQGIYDPLCDVRFAMCPTGKPEHYNASLLEIVEENKKRLQSTTSSFNTGLSDILDMSLSMVTPPWWRVDKTLERIIMGVSIPGTIFIFFGMIFMFYKIYRRIKLAQRRKRRRQLLKAHERALRVLKQQAIGKTTSDGSTGLDTKGKKKLLLEQQKTYLFSDNSDIDSENDNYFENGEDNGLEFASRNDSITVNKDDPEAVAAAVAKRRRRKKREKARQKKEKKEKKAKKKRKGGEKGNNNNTTTNNNTTDRLDDEEDDEYANERDDIVTDLRGLKGNNQRNNKHRRSFNANNQNNNNNNIMSTSRTFNNQRYTNLGTITEDGDETSDHPGNDNDNYDLNSTFRNHYPLYDYSRSASHSRLFDRNTMILGGGTSAALGNNNNISFSSQFGGGNGYYKTKHQKPFGNLNNNNTPHNNNGNNNPNGLNHPGIIDGSLNIQPGYYGGGMNRRFSTTESDYHGNGGGGGSGEYSHNNNNNWQYQQEQSLNNNNYNHNYYQPWVIASKTMGIESALDIDEDEEMALLQEEMHDDAPSEIQSRAWRADIERMKKNTTMRKKTSGRRRILGNPNGNSNNSRNSTKQRMLSRRQQHLNNNNNNKGGGDTSSSSDSENSSGPNSRNNNNNNNNNNNTTNHFETNNDFQNQQLYNNNNNQYQQQFGNQGNNNNNRDTPNTSPDTSLVRRPPPIIQLSNGSNTGSGSGSSGMNNNNKPSPGRGSGSSGNTNNGNGNNTTNNNRSNNNNSYFSNNNIIQSNQIQTPRDVVSNMFGGILNTNNLNLNNNNNNNNNNNLNNRYNSNYNNNANHTTNGLPGTDFGFSSLLEYSRFTNNNNNNNNNIVSPNYQRQSAANSRNVSRPPSARQSSNDDDGNNNNNNNNDKNSINTPKTTSTRTGKNSTSTGNNSNPNNNNTTGMMLTHGIVNAHNLQLNMNNNTHKQGINNNTNSIINTISTLTTTPRVPNIVNTTNSQYNDNDYNNTKEKNKQKISKQQQNNKNNIKIFNNPFQIIPKLDPNKYGGLDTLGYSEYENFLQRTGQLPTTNTAIVDKLVDEQRFGGNNNPMRTNTNAIYNHMNDINNIANHNDRIEILDNQKINIFSSPPTAQFIQNNNNNNNEDDIRITTTISNQYLPQTDNVYNKQHYNNQFEQQRSSSEIKQIVNPKQQQQQPKNSQQYNTSSTTVPAGAATRRQYTNKSDIYHDFNSMLSRVVSLSSNKPDLYNSKHHSYNYNPYKQHANYNANYNRKNNKNKKSKIIINKTQNRDIYKLAHIAQQTKYLSRNTSHVERLVFAQQEIKINSQNGKKQEQLKQQKQQNNNTNVINIHNVRQNNDHTFINTNQQMTNQFSNNNNNTATNNTYNLTQNNNLTQQYLHHYKTFVKDDIRDAVHVSLSRSSNNNENDKKTSTINNNNKQKQKQLTTSPSPIMPSSLIDLLNPTTIETLKFIYNRTAEWLGLEDILSTDNSIDSLSSSLSRNSNSNTDLTSSSLSGIITTSEESDEVNSSSTEDDIENNKDNKNNNKINMNNKNKKQHRSSMLNTMNDSYDDITTTDINTLSHHRGIIRFNIDNDDVQVGDVINWGHLSSSSNAFIDSGGEDDVDDDENYQNNIHIVKKPKKHQSVIDIATAMLNDLETNQIDDDDNNDDDIDLDGISNKKSIDNGVYKKNHNIPPSFSSPDTLGNNKHLDQQQQQQHQRRGGILDGLQLDDDGLINLFDEDDVNIIENKQDDNTQQNNTVHQLDLLSGMMGDQEQPYLVLHSLDDETQNGDNNNNNNSGEQQNNKIIESTTKQKEDDDEQDDTEDGDDNNNNNPTSSLISAELTMLSKLATMSVIADDDDIINNSNNPFNNNKNNNNTSNIGIVSTDINLNQMKSFIERYEIQLRELEVAIQDNNGIKYLLQKRQDYKENIKKIYILTHPHLFIPITPGVIPIRTGINDAKASKNKDKKTGLQKNDKKHNDNSTTTTNNNTNNNNNKQSDIINLFTNLADHPPQYMSNQQNVNNQQNNHNTTHHNTNFFDYEQEGITNLQQPIQQQQYQQPQYQQPQYQPILIAPPAATTNTTIALASNTKKTSCEYPMTLEDLFGDAMPIDDLVNNTNNNNHNGHNNNITNHNNNVNPSTNNNNDMGNHYITGDIHIIDQPQTPAIITALLKQNEYNQQLQQQQNQQHQQSSYYYPDPYQLTTTQNQQQQQLHDEFQLSPPPHYDGLHPFKYNQQDNNNQQNNANNNNPLNVTNNDKQTSNDDTAPTTNAINAIISPLELLESDPYYLAFGKTKDEIEKTILSLQDQLTIILPLVILQQHIQIYMTSDFFNGIDRNNNNNTININNDSNIIIRDPLQRLQYIRRFNTIYTTQQRLTDLLIQQIAEQRKEEEELLDAQRIKYGLINNENDQADNNNLHLEQQHQNNYNPNNNNNIDADILNNNNSRDNHDDSVEI